MTAGITSRRPTASGRPFVPRPRARSFPGTIRLTSASRSRSIRMVVGDFLPKPVGLGSEPRDTGNSGTEPQVVAIDALPGTRELFDITTGTGDFIANGVVSHNCYARPNHACLGLSPGLDFEMRLYFKPQAAERLIHELAAPRHVPGPITLCVNTDPYRPFEKPLGVTRQILEVLRDCRHPISIVSKSTLIERDLEILVPMACAGLVGVMASLTSHDSGLERCF